MDQLLASYQAVADGSCYHYAQAELLRLKDKADPDAPPEALHALAERVWRCVAALEQAVAEWSGEEFYALGIGDDPSRLARR